MGGVVTIVTAMRPGPAWPNEMDRKWSVGASWFWAVVMAGNTIAGSQPYLRAVMLVVLLSPALVFIRATSPAAEGREAPQD